MKIAISLGLIAVSSFVSAQNVVNGPSFENFLSFKMTNRPFTNVLAEDRINIDYNETLACGACIRGGWYYCQDKHDEKRRRAQNDFCCPDLLCVLEFMTKKDRICGTSDPNNPSYVYSDRYVMLQKFCKRRQNSTVCCPRKDGKRHDDDECEIELKKNVTDNLVINLDELDFGGSCTYEIESKCGYPKISVNNSNIDMVVAFKRKHWDDDNFRPDNQTTFDTDETFNPRW